MSSSSNRSARNTFAAAPINRLTEQRDNAQWLEEIHAQALELLIDNQSLVGAAPDAERLRFQLCAAAPMHASSRWYLGQAQNTHYFARVVDSAEHIDLNWLDLRAAALKLPPVEAGLAAYARGLQFWHARHGFCGVCGSATRSEQAGHRRRCTNSSCGAEHFPRTDPAIIVAVEFEGDILLGRQASWPPGRYSTLAGFVEPGETLEDALVREVYEEAGVRVISCDYISSQPWPFPASLMLGFTAQAANREVKVGAELEHARYFSVAQFEQAVLDQTLKTPPAVSVSYRLIEQWYERHARRSFSDLLAASSQRKQDALQHARP